MHAAIYARQSVEKEGSVSVEAQIECCRALCEKKGLSCIVYSDVGFSGKTLARPGFERLLRDMEAETVGAVVTYRLDRISRSLTDFARLLELFERRGVPFCSATEPFDTSTPAGRAMIYIVMVFAQLERETITQRVSDNYRYRAAQGLFMGGNAPLGYTAKPIETGGRRAAMLVKEAQTAQTVCTLYRLYAQGLGTQGTARALNAAGYTTGAGRTFTAAGVARILRNPAYCRAQPEAYDYLMREGVQMLCPRDDFDGRAGVCCFGKSREKHRPVPADERLATVGLHEALIDAADWVAVQRMLNGSSHAPRGRGGAYSWLTGLLRCGACGGSLCLRTVKRQDKIYRYFCCTEGRAGCLNTRWLPAQALEEPVRQALLRHVTQFCGNPTGTPPAPAQPASAVKPENAAFERALSLCRNEIDAQLARIRAGDVQDDPSSLSERLAALSALAGRARKQTEAKAYFSPTEVQAAFDTACAKEKGLFAKAFIAGIRVAAKGNAALLWRV